MFLMKIQPPTYRQQWQQSCSAGQQDAALAGRNVSTCNGRKTNRLGQTGRGSGGGAAGRRTPPTRIRDARGETPGEDPARPAATVGLVSPPGGIVLWDEWHAALEPRGDGEHPETRSTLSTGENIVASAQKGGERGPKQKMMAMVKNTNPNQEFRRGERTI